MRALFPQSARNVLIEREDSWGNLRVRFTYSRLNQLCRADVRA
jgi:hypothetical protein